MNAEENKPVEYNGKTYTKYEATQRQRRLETTMRAQRQKIKLLEEGGADEQALIAARAKYVKTSDEYVNFSKSMGLSQQWDRVTVGSNSLEGITKPKKANSPIGGIKTTSLPVKSTEKNSINGKFAVEKSGGSGIIKTDKQFGKKVGKHAIDWGLNPASEDDRKALEGIIDDIYINHDVPIRTGEWRGQTEDVLFYIKGEDVVITKKNGEFVTVMRGGINNARVKNAREL